MGAKRVLGPFHAWQTAGLNASKKPLMWPGRRRKDMDMALVPGVQGHDGCQKGFGAVSRLANGRLERQ